MSPGGDGGDPRRPEIRLLEVDSRLLRGNPMSDPHQRRLPVYLPPHYDSKRPEPYPVVFLLAGWGGRGARYLHDEGAFAPTLPERWDRMIEAGESPPFLAVFPDATTRLGASQYVNSIATGRYMDYLCDEVVPFVDARFHTHGHRSHRGLLGHSSGGFGALVTGMLRADTFGYLCSSAGDSWFENLYRKPIPMMIDVIQREGGIEALFKKFLAHEDPMRHSTPQISETVMNLSMCACFVPNLSVPVIRGDLWFDLDTGELIPSVWERFLGWDPIQMVDRNVKNLRTLEWIHLEAGRQDEYGLHLGHRQVAKRLKRVGVDCVLEEYPGRHGGHHWRFASRVKRMVEKMG